MKYCYLLLLITSTFAQSYKCIVNEKTTTTDNHVTYINFDRQHKKVTRNDGSVSIYYGNNIILIADVNNASSVSYIRNECNVMGFQYAKGKCRGVVTQEKVLAILNKEDPSGTFASLFKLVLDTIPASEIVWRTIGHYDDTEVLYVNKDGFTRSFPNKTQGEKSRSIEFVDIMVDNSMTFQATDGGVFYKAEIKIDKITGHLRFTIDGMAYFDYKGTCVEYNN